MSTNSLASSRQSFLSQIETHPTTNRADWIPPAGEWEKSADTRQWIETMAQLGLRSKACSAFECGDYYVPITWHHDHYVRLGRTTCQCKTCHNCGTGKMRLHRMHLSNPERLEVITSDSCRTLKLIVHYSTPAASLPAYIQRVHSHKSDINRMRRRYEREFKGKWGHLVTPEFDPRAQTVTWRMYFIGYDPGHKWFERTWQRIVGLQASCESLRRGPEQEAVDGLRWTLDGILALLELKGADRAAWETAMQSYRFTTCVGSMRGVETAGMTQKPKDPDAPWGRCPCGCGGALEKATSKTPAPLSSYKEKYKIIEIGPVKTYGHKNRSKVGAESPISSTVTPVASSPPI